MTTNEHSKSKIDWTVLGISGGLLSLFVIISFINLDAITAFVNTTFGWSVTYFGAFWQLLMLATFVVSIWLAMSKYGKIKLGNMSNPEISTFKWVSMIMATLLAGGGVFWAAAEPMYHFMDSPPLFNNNGNGSGAAPALAQSFMHWGFLAWAILGTLSAVVLMYGHYHKGMPMKPRTLLYPMFGDKINHGIAGKLIDAFSIISVAAGTIGPIGFLGLQASYGLQAVFGIPDVFVTQLVIIIGVVIISTISAVTGLYKGIQWLSKFNVRLALVLMAILLIVGPAGFIIDQYVVSLGTYLDQFISMGMYRGDDDWLGLWTIFFWGWFIGYGPMMAMLVSRISRGRTVREIMIAVSVIAPLVTTFWFTVVGGSGIFFEIQNPGSVSDALMNTGMHAAMIAITEQFPLASVITPLFLLLTILFVVTTTDSMAFTISMGVTGEENPPGSIRIFWAVLMGIIAAILLYIGEGSVEALQNFIVVTAVPVSILLLPMIWLAPRVVKKMAKGQGIK
ncbi:BCCT family transporter [Salibacterium salarium]|uniref:BCCT family transporter n=1 Tax=Salibacterium salarium TaxID=284579 RepID=UPI0027D7AC66|nr:BCCT family transporter [Salibacterium salarium]